MQIDPEKTLTFTIRIRIPGWAVQHPFPGNLYYTNDSNLPVTLRVNGKPIPLVIEKGCAIIKRHWEKR